MKRTILLLILAVVLAAAGAVGFAVLQDRQTKYETDLTGLEVPRYAPFELDFEHHYNILRGLPYTGAAVLDVDNDGREELFVGGGIRQSDGLFVFSGDRFINAADQAGLVKLGGGLTLGAAVIDCDDNGFDDLIVSRENGVFLYSNHSGRFEMEKIDLDLPRHAYPLGIVIGDLNHDGHFDFLLPMVRKTSPWQWFRGVGDGEPIEPRLYINNGDNTFYDMTEGAGLQGLEETFQAGWIDLDGDGLEDLVALHTSGRISTWKNTGNLLFVNKPHYHSGLKGDYMGMAAGDYDNDGRIDLLLTNCGGTMPRYLLDLLGSRRGDAYIRWILMNNNGFFSFRKDAARARVADYELGRGALFVDANADGREDVIVSQNHPDWPLYLFEPFRLPGKFLLQTKEKTFASATDESGVVNRGFGVTPLVADFNKDGRPDMIHVNIDGKTKVFLSRGGENHYLDVQLPRRATSLGAVVTVKTLAGKIIQRQYLAGKGLSSASSATLFFGLAADRAIEVSVEYADGRHDQTSGVLYNTTVTFE